MVNKVKNKILIIVSVVLIAFILKVNFGSNRVDNVEFVYEQRTQKDYLVYYYDDTSLVNVIISLEDDDIITTLFNLLTNQSNSIKEDYQTKLITSTNIIDYYDDGNNLTLNLSSDFLRYKDSDAFYIINQLKNTFSNLGYDKLYIKVDSEYINNIANIVIKDGINLSNI